MLNGAGVCVYAQACRWDAAGYIILGYSAQRFIEDQQSQRISLTHLPSRCVSHFSPFTEGVDDSFLSTEP